MKVYLKQRISFYFRLALACAWAASVANPSVGFSKPKGLAAKRGVSFVDIADIPTGASVTLPGQFSLRMGFQTEAVLGAPEGATTAVRFENVSKLPSTLDVLTQGAAQKRSLKLKPGETAFVGIGRSPTRFRVTLGELVATSQEPLQINK